MRPAAVEGADLGSQLRAVRRRRRISLRRAADETRIPARYIEALERNATVEAFPGSAYAKGFLRIYAQYLRLPESLLDGRFDEQGSPAIESLSVLQDATPRRRWRWRESLLATVLIGAAISVGAGGKHPSPPRPRPPVLGLLPAAATAARPGAGSLAETGVAEPGAVDPMRAAAAGPLAVTVRVGGRSSWLRVIADGKTAIAGFIARSGYEARFHAHRAIEITVGNAAAVELLIGGRWTGPVGAPGGVRRILVTWSNGTPVIRYLNRA